NSDCRLGFKATVRNSCWPSGSGKVVLWFKSDEDYLKPNLELSQDQVILYHRNISEKGLN
ncbi:unnamed protein product, partial [Porites evermanni]